MTEILIKAENVSKKFCRSLKKSLWYGLKDMASELLGSSNTHEELREGEFWANKDISFEIRRGETIGLIGHNGAGKTTLLRMLNGLIKPDKGRIEIKGRMQALIALGAGFNPILSGRENIYVNAAILGIPKVEVDRKFEEIVDFSGISEFIDTPVQSYSSGMVVRLGFAVATNMEPDILLVDEVLAVGDRDFQSKCLNKIGELRKNGLTVILVSHNLRMIGAFCKHAIYMSRGQIERFGESKDVIGLYLKNSSKKVGETSIQKIEKVGSGRLIIESVVFQNENAKDDNIVLNSMPVEMIIDYSSMEDLHNIDLDIVFRDEFELVLYQGTNHFYHTRIDLGAGQGCIKVVFEHFPFNNQRLYLSLAIWAEKRQEMLEWQYGIPFYVEGNPLSEGKLDLFPKFCVT